MKELFRHKDYTITSYYNSLLKAEGIQTMLRNENLHMTGLTEIPIPEFYPNICVMNDADYERAREIILKVMKSESVDADKEIQCPKCEEPNPGNFELCYACGEAFL